MRQQADNLLARLDRIYDLYRDCLLNQEYYGHQLNQVSRAAFWLEIAIVVGSGTSGVSGWIIWTKYPASATAWGIIAAMATLLAALKPVFQIDTKLKRYSTLFSGYRQLTISMKMVVDEIAETAGIPNEIEKEINRIRTRYRTLATDDDPRPSSKLVQRIQTEINTRIPLPSLFYPSCDAPFAFDVSTVALTSNVDCIGMKIDPVNSLPPHKATS